MQQYIFRNMDGVTYSNFLDIFEKLKYKEQLLVCDFCLDSYRWVFGELAYDRLRDSLFAWYGLNEIERTLAYDKIVGIDFKVSSNIDPNTVRLERKEPKTYINTIYPSVDKALQNLKKGINKIYSSDKEAIMNYKIKDVIFSGPCTIVLWKDGTKTIVRCENEFFDREKGLAMAICKKVLGTNNSGSNYYDIFKKWCSEEEINQDKITHYITVKEFSKTAGVSESTIRKRLRAGQFPGAIKQSGAW